MHFVQEQKFQSLGARVDVLLKSRGEETEIRGRRVEPGMTADRHGYTKARGRMGPRMSSGTSRADGSRGINA